ncbi:alpha-mannosidase [Microbacterium sp. SYP-A9085]|uniref:alpha-mannosidase n=1 Tax=Microbacterium sp. SYP-A9085 TaxID=2664454 RepID=UPI00129ADB46|nr:glycoside hydrolase family 38 C-terminal domain-containing protein [Microbacterium sp. SYP-A9085]MRH28064.1 alpha-mannosidase [Microbacterium sp. SYP-A9085]
MHEQQSLTIRRVRRVLEERLRPAVHSDPHPLGIAAHTVGGEPIPVAEGLAGPFTPFEIGREWGRAWDTTWFRVTGRIPASFAGRRVEAVVDLGFDAAMPGFQAEGLVYLADGTPVRAIHPRAQWVPIDAAGEVEFFVEAAANPVVLDAAAPFRPTEQGEWDTAGDRPLYRFARADLCVFEAEVFELVHDVEVLLQLAEQLPDASTRRARILRALDDALDAVDLQDVAGTAGAARAVLAQPLAAPAEHSAQRITAIGHAHIDSAWLWPLRETVRKVARTATSMTRLLDEHPEFVYAMSSAQQYAWLRDERPEVFARVKAAVADGRFLPVGGMWVECDAVLPGGESLIRQIAYGQRFFREEFGIECRGAWLPDSFGYSGALPQILAGAGFEWFLTQKMSWNQTNRFPHHTFWWEGIDGTRVFTHFPPMDTYESQLTGAEIARATRQFAEKAAASSSLAPTGYGDGGGGTTREAIARARRLADLEGSARVAWETPDAFFARARAELPDAPVWRGELYLELHRATYTTQHAMKQGNRRSEELLRQAELWAATAALRAGRPYPYEVLDDVWREVLLLQFHDILPGSSIAWVHREARERYARIERTLRGVIGDALAALGVGIGGDAVLVNPATVPQRGVPAGGVGVGSAPVARRAEASGDGFVLSSDHVRVVVDAAGRIVSARDLATGREAIPAGLAGNLLQLHQDFPSQWDAWDVDAHYRGRYEDLTGRAHLDGDAVVVETAFGASSITQRLTLSDDGRTLEIDNTVDWRETERFLKLAVPVDVFTDEVTAEAQFGHHRRPTHENTSWDAAKFEQHAQRWFLLAEPGFGVAFLSDSTYGFDVTRREHQGRIVSHARFSMLRAPRYPDPRTDQGTQRMRFGLVVAADVRDAATAASRFTAPAVEAFGGDVRPLVEVAGAALSAVKLADDRSGDLVVRVYESTGGRAAASLTIPAGDLVRADLLERPGESVPVVDGTVQLTLRPFEIATLRVRG